MFLMDTCREPCPGQAAWAPHYTELQPACRLLQQRADCTRFYLIPNFALTLPNCWINESTLISISAFWAVYYLNLLKMYKKCCDGFLKVFIDEKPTFMSLKLGFSHRKKISWNNFTLWWIMYTFSKKFNSNKIDWHRFF